MSEMQNVTLRMPIELKFRLENEAKQQGMSFEDLANYLMVAQLRQIEILSGLESKRAKKSLADLKVKVNKILDGVPKREDVPDWDSFE